MNVNPQGTRLIILTSILFLALVIFSSINQISAVGEVSVCCERTVEGAWCQSSPPAECNPSYRSAATSCEATSYCRLGTCVDSQEGICLENTPQKVCQDNSGVWVEGEPEDIPQCQLGCCIVGDQAAFVTQTRCKSLSSLYGLETNFRTDIKTEAACIASASPQERGACVLDDDFSRNCRLLTRQECQQLETTSSSDTQVEFHEGFLCSAESLATDCGPSQKTTCVEDKDEVYFLDTCGNLANIYDASKINNQEYWTTIKTKAESCNPDSSNANSVSCGNCDYLSGSTCKEYERGNSQTVKPSYGDFVCADLSCEYKGQSYKHGETWCADSPGIDEKKNLPGSEYFRLVCYNGEVSVEQCSAFREEACIEDVIETDEGDFRTAACRVNKWQDCTFQDNKNDCENIDERDCKWMENQSILRDDQGRTLVINEDGELVQQGQGEKFEVGRTTGIQGSVPILQEKGAACVPKYAPGFDFWVAKEDGGEAEDLCFIASQECVVKFEKPLGGTWHCDENCECIGLKKGDNPVGGIAKVSKWVGERNNLCLALGDCGNSKNYVGIDGYQSTNAVKLNRDIA